MGTSRMKFFLSTGAFLAASLFASSPVSAASVNLQVCAEAACWNGSYTIADAQVVNWTNVETMPNGNGTSVDTWEANKGMNLSDWSLSMDSDPFITNNFVITNTGSSTQTFTISTLLGVSPAIPNGVMNGTIGLSLTDNPGTVSGATFATSGVSSIYTASIDGNVARTLWNPTTSFSTTRPQSFSNNTFFGSEAAPESTDTSIGLSIKFSLTAGDTVAVTSYFEVTPIPVPAAVWMFGTGLLGLLGVAGANRSKPSQDKN